MVVIKKKYLTLGSRTIKIMASFHIFLKSSKYYCMKNVLTLFLVVCLFAACKTSQQGASQKGELVIKFVTTNTIEGYDHVSKLKVFCDDVLVGESSEKKQSIPNQMTVKLPTGKHTIKATLFRQI